MMYIGTAALFAGMLVLFLFYYAARSQEKEQASEIPQAVTGELLHFLEKADDAYILTHETLEIRFFSRYATNLVCNEIMEAIYQKPPKMFGTRRFRHRSWSIVTQNGSELVVRKELVHKPIVMKKGIRVALGDDMVELWTITCHTHGFIIKQVTEPLRAQ
ncbi:hypothetical protein B5M42_000885 [Paenibacillus athensensis]|uniref:Uncharacterized protein n=1 Tax=Paenibacillus athensensis TaxID=1967502 RepID=A0A4Y8Q743_9BACL|nr:hypothetical protein [Paenibacillus athensensis]MCD1257390.1 hypothetical protein [Paenibacillus athensensis]